MSSFRRILALSLVAAALGAVGCSNDVKVGAVISQTGAVATYGSSVRKGIDLALEEINAAGGYKGGQFTVIYKDDATMPDIGEQVTRELIEQDGVKYIIGAVSSPVTLHIAPICEEKGVVLLSPSASAPEVSSAGDYIFRNYPSDVLEGTSMARWAKDQGFEKVVIFALDNAFGRGLTQVFTDEYEGKYRKIVGTFTFPDTQTSDFGEMIAQMKELAPDGIYIISYDEALAALLHELYDAGNTAVLMGTSSVPDSIARTVGEAAEKLIYPRPGFDIESNDPQVVHFIDAYRTKYGEDPDSYAAHGYDALYLIKKAIEATDSTHPMNVKLGLLSIKDYKGAAGITGFDKNGDVVRYPRLFVIHQGKAMPYDKFKEEGLSLERKGS
jgi:branched-chain amino acid transport system substrate-binding protein